MHILMTRFAPAVCFLAAALAVTPALAAGLNLGGVAQVPAVGGFPGRVSPAAMSGFGNGPGTVSGVGMNVSNADGVTVQTNIDASRNVQAGSTISVNRTINGVAVSSTSGGDFLAGADAQAQDVWAQKQAFYQQLQDQASMMVQVWQAPAY
jgi:hypothetical protein